MSFRLLHYSDLEAIYDEPERAGAVAGLVARLRTEPGPDPILLGSGDNTAPGVLSLVTEGHCALHLYDAIEPDVETFGNHDFDYGLAATESVVERSPQQWVSSNAFLDGERFGADSGVRPWTVIERDEGRLGVFGVLDDSTPALNPAAADLTVTDPIRAAEKAVDALSSADVDAIVALSHLGQRDEELAASVDVDAVLGGHVPKERVERIDGTLLTRPGAGGNVLHEISLPDGSVTRHEVADAPIDTVVATALRERLRAAGLGDVVARVSEPIDRTEATVFRGESRIGNFVTDAYRWAADADVALQNSGGIRSGPPLAGDVTVEDLISVVPFEEPVSVAAVSGAELLEIFAGANGATLGFAEPDWWHAQVSGARLRWDDDAHELLEATVGGEPIDPDRTYRLATTDYLFYTGAEFPALTEAHRIERLPTQHEVLVEYAREVGIDPSIEGRIDRRVE